MKLPAAAYSAEVATSLRRLEAAGHLAKFSDPSARAFGRRAEATTLLRLGYGGLSLPCLLRRSSRFGCEGRASP